MIPIFIRNRLVVSLVAIPIGLVVNLIFRFWGHIKTYENNHFLGQRKRMTMITTPTSTSNQTMKVKRPKEGLGLPS